MPAVRSDWGYMSECVDEGEFGGDASEFPALILTYRHMVRIFGIHILDCRDVIVKEILHGAGAYECQLFVFLDAGFRGYGHTCQASVLIDRFVDEFPVNAVIGDSVDYG